MIEQTPEGYWVVKGETHMNVWVRENKRLDHDRYSIPIACSYIKKGSTVIDVGANIGTHTIAYLESVGSKGFVAAYEPHPESFECLYLNCPNAYVCNYAVGDIRGHSHLDMVDGNLGASFLSDHGREVTVTTLDIELRDGVYPDKPISFIKIDVEGCESEVLTGAEELVRKHRPIIMLEVNNGALARRGHSYMDIFDFMNRHSYGSRFLPPTNTWESAQSDVIFTPI